MAEARWFYNAKVLALFSIHEEKNAWVWLQGEGADRWIKISPVNESTFQTIFNICVSAHNRNSPVDARVDAFDPQRIVEIYGW